ncbi:MAG: glycosyltransferase family 2 protein [Acidobacteriota bacterium]|nr:glycosyltransferase family 2 protein [Acidobacteriota bacterium]
MTLHLLLRALIWLTALRWLAQFLEAAIWLPRVPDLTSPAFDRTPSDSPSLTVIVPARNESPGIEACLLSLLRQDYPNLRILAVDDRSTDSTGALMDTLAGLHPHRLHVLHITVLPPGWLGKTHAMATAARHAIASAPPDYLLFTDGDILFAPGILRRSLAHAQAVRADHLVTLPTTLIRSPGEAMLLSFLQVLSLFAVRPWRVASPRSRDAIGVGAFNLLRTQAYLRIGGFEAMPLEILEDLTLGRTVKAHRLRQRAVYAPGAVAVHWASGLFGLLRGMTKNLFPVFRYQPLLLLAGALGLNLFCAAPFLLLAWPGARLPGALASLSLLGLYLLAGRRSRISPAWALLAPVAAALLGYSMLRSMLTTLRNGGITWRGTFYPLATLRHPTATATSTSS